MSVESCRPLLAVLVSLAAAGLILASGRRPNLREFWTFAAGVLKFGLVASMLPGVLAGRVYECTLWRIAPGMELALKADAMGFYFALLASGLWIITSVYSVGYMRSLKEHAQPRYFAAFAVCLSSAIGEDLSHDVLEHVVNFHLAPACKGYSVSLDASSRPTLTAYGSKADITSGAEYPSSTIRFCSRWRAS